MNVVAAVPAHGRVEYTDGLKYKSKATYSCEAGYSLQGDSQRACQADGNWTNESPTCKGEFHNHIV